MPNMNAKSPCFSTQRLILRRWRATDREPFAQLTADPQVMRHMFPGPLSRMQSDALADRIEAHFDVHGFGMWALEIPGVTPFAGFVGLSVPSYQAPFTPCVEVGWRIAPPRVVPKARRSLTKHNSPMRYLLQCH